MSLPCPASKSRLHFSAHGPSLGVRSPQPSISSLCPTRAPLLPSPQAPGITPAHLGKPGRSCCGGSLVTPAKSLLPCKVTCSQVRESGQGHLLGATVLLATVTKRDSEAPPGPQLSPPLRVRFLLCKSGRCRLSLTGSLLGQPLARLGAQ